jgi:lysophospholipase L1-like esterase
MMLSGASCSSSPQQIEKAPPRMIVIFGDSTSAPRTNIHVFASILQERLPRTLIVNAGVPGNNTRDALMRLDRDVISRHPDVVTIWFGINDSAVDVWKGASQPRISLAEYKANLQQIIQQIRGSGATPILLTPNPVCWTRELLKLYGEPPYEPDNPDGWNVLLRQYAQAVREIAAREKTPIVDVDCLFRTYAAEPNHRLGDLLSDGMHPNDAGHRLIADAILSVLAGELASKR